MARAPIGSNDQSGHPLYTSWASMKARCSNPKNRSYPDYGGRGITVDPLWQHDFGAFRDHVVTVLGAAPSEDYQLDRIDNDGPYAPGNLQWATRSEQMKNRRYARSRDFEKIKAERDGLVLKVADLEATLHAAETERNAALYQLREQNQKLDAAEMTIEIMRDDL